MDAYSVSCTSASEKHLSMIYQDLQSSRCHSTAKHGTFARSSLAMGTTTEMLPKPHVGIVGAGLAGLRCADVLGSHGFKVTIIEGRDRIGGRMTQQRLPNGHLVDLGPNWIHGTDDNPMLDLAKATGTATCSWDTNSGLFDEEGKLFTLEDGEAYSTQMWDIVQAAFKWSNQHWTTIPPEESLWDFFLRKVPEKVPDTEPDFERKRRIILQVAELWGAFVGSPVTRQSLRYFWLEECIEGESLFCAGTYQKVLEAVAKSAKERATILYNKRAVKVRTKTEDRPKPAVDLDSGETLEFDEIVFTAPLGWLKQNLDAFEPDLPERLQRGIRSIGYGCLEKVYICFPKAFWLVPDEQGRVVQGFCQWLSPNYALDTNPRRWNQEIVELASTGPDTAHPTLLFYIYGEESEYVTKHVSQAKTLEERDKFLYELFRPYYSRLPGYDAHSAECQPSGSLATTWLQDDLAGNGSYSNFQAGLEQGDQDIRVMREGLPERGLWLAGEHTAPFVALGTATGAYWAGESVGRRIAEAYGRGNEEVGKKVGGEEKL
ncbi:flavin-containing amine oxidoreductase [Plectosphaerella cucumerina]|uniref:Flavin-containing amine oxidoreductase n=1 Tax=Plectosphaerella cucumerina TaxID=40658 RepID=A0A8K0TGG5_9PEZI|nr:flavin-containing amine oxidoreductase [Plectosphaerella cucumerina]